MVNGVQPSNTTGCVAWLIRRIKQHVIWIKLTYVEWMTGYNSLIWMVVFPKWFNGQKTTRNHVKVTRNMH